MGNVCRKSVLLGCHFSLVIALTLGSSCGRKAGSSSSSTVSNPDVGIVDDSAGFYVRAYASSDYTYKIHRGGTATATSKNAADSFNYTLDCKINTDETDANLKDMICYLEGNELDLYFHGVSLQHNFPSSMCSYVEIKLPWYYTYPAGIGGTQAISTSIGAPPVYDPTQSAHDNNGTAFCGYDHSKWTQVFDSSGAYVRTDGWGYGPNCCLGTYTRSVFVTGADPSITPNQSWGGNVKDCIGGPAADLQQKDKLGIPMSDIYYVQGKGLNGITKVDSPLTKKKVSNLYIANYFMSRNYDKSGSFPIATRPPLNANLPRAMPQATGVGLIPGTVPDVVPLTATFDRGNPFFDYRCYDRAMEVKYRVRVLVRSWDEEALTGVATSYGFGASGASGIAIKTTSWKSYVAEPTPFDNFTLHDFYVWDETFRSGLLKADGTADTTTMIGTTPVADPRKELTYLDGYPRDAE